MTRMAKEVIVIITEQINVRNRNISRIGYSFTMAMTIYW